MHTFIQLSEGFLYTWYAHKHTHLWALTIVNRLNHQMQSPVGKVNLPAIKGWIPQQHLWALGNTPNPPILNYLSPWSPSEEGSWFWQENTTQMIPFLPPVDDQKLFFWLKLLFNQLSLKLNPFCWIWRDFMALVWWPRDSQDDASPGSVWREILPHDKHEDLTLLITDIPVMSG